MDRDVISKHLEPPEVSSSRELPGLPDPHISMPSSHAGSSAGLDVVSRAGLEPTSEESTSHIQGNVRHTAPEQLVVNPLRFQRPIAEVQPQTAATERLDVVPASVPAATSQLSGHNELRIDQSSSVGSHPVRLSNPGEGGDD